MSEQDALAALLRRLSIAKSVPEIARTVAEGARAVLNADGVTFVLRVGDECYYADEDAIAPLWKGKRFPMEACISGWCMLQKASAIIPDIHKDPRIPQEAYRPTFVRSLAMVPVCQDEPLAAMGAYWAKPRRIDTRDVETLQAIANAAGLAMKSVEGQQAVEAFKQLEKQSKAQDALRESQERLRLAQRAGRSGDFEWIIPEGRVIWSSALEVLYGLEEGAFEGTFEDWRKRVVASDAEEVARGVEECLDQGRTDFSYEFRAILPDGTFRWFAGEAQFLYDADGAPLRMIGINMDIDARKHASEELRRRAEEFQTLADNMSQFAWMADAAGWIYWYNKRWFDYTGTTLEEMQGWGWRKVHHPDHVDRVVERITTCFERGELWEDTFPLRSRDGEYRWFLSRAVPIRDESGNVVRWFGTNTDITERLEAEEQRKLLIDELHHRVKNILATVQAIAAQTFRSADIDAGVQDSFEARLTALSEAHSRLTQDEWKSAELGQIIREAMQPHAHSKQFELQGPEIRLPPRAAIAMAMGIHELATNALKYGALSTESGKVDVHWRIAPEGCGTLNLNWSETGGPAIAGPPEKKGFGTTLIERYLAHELDGCAEIDFRPQGLVCTISGRLPLAETG